MVRSESKTPPASGEVADQIAEAVFALAGRLIVGLGLLAWWSVLFPMLSLPIAVSGFVAWRFGWPWGVFTAAEFVSVLLAWRMTAPALFYRLVTGRIRRLARKRRYRGWWADVTALHGLSATLNDKVLIPELWKVKTGEAEDRLEVRMLTGQTPDDWHQQAEALAHAFDAASVRVRPVKPRWIDITVRHADPLTAIVPMHVPADHEVDVMAVPVGVTETGKRWLVRLLGRHVLIAGATGAGKGSVLWSILAGVAPAIRDGLVTVWVIDPKGGMEFGPGQPLYTRFACEDADGMLTLLRDAATVLTERARRLRGVTRQHVPMVAEPLILLLVDEIATLTAYADRKTRTEAEQLLGLILSQGRAVGVSVIAAVQDPSKEVLTLRQLFPTRIALRLSEPTQAAMVLGDGARDRGALCEQIPDSLPGVGYVAEDGTAELIRVRASHITDQDLTHLTRHYAPGGLRASWSDNSSSCGDADTRGDTEALGGAA